MRTYEKISTLLREYQDIDTEDLEHKEKINSISDDPKSERSVWEELVYGKEASAS